MPSTHANDAAPKKKRRRFHTVEQIEGAIDDAKTNALALDTEADAENDLAQRLMRAGSERDDAGRSVRDILDNRDALRAKSRGIYNSTIPRLKERIGIMRTVAPKELVGDDPSIPRS